MATDIAYIKGPWWTLKPLELGPALKAVVKRLENDQKWRKEHALRRYSTYFGRRVTSLKEIEQGLAGNNVWSYSDPTIGGEDISFSKSAIDTCVARIAAKQRPKPVVLTSGADYKTRLQARKRSKFLEGQFQECQGSYSTIYDLGYDVFRDSAICDGVAKVEADFTLKKVSVSRLFTWDIYFDELDAQSGKPTQLYERQRLDRYTLIRRYPKHKAAILNAKGCEDVDHRVNGMDQRRVEVWECYVLPTSPEEVGKRVLLVDETVLEESDYEHDQFPHVFLFWQRSPVGVRGVPPIDYARRPQLIANRLYNYCLNNTELLSGGYIDVPEGAYNDQALVSNDTLKVLKRDPGATSGVQVHMPNPFNGQVLDLAERNRQLVFELFGVSELSSQGRKEPGLDSGKALRNMTDLQDQRFLTQARALEQFYVDIGKAMLRAVGDLSAEGIKPESFLPSQGFIESIAWDAIEIGEKSLYTVQVQAGSSLDDSYGARLQFVSELQQSGAIDAQTASRLLLSGNPDLESINNRQTAQYNWVERIICEIHDADNDVDPDVESPDPLMDLPAAAAQMIDAYLEVSSWPDTPEGKRRAMRQWIEQCVELIQRANPPAPPEPPGGPAGAPSDSAMAGPPPNMQPPMAA